MASVRPLKQLLEQADAFSKSASAAAPVASKPTDAIDQLIALMDSADAPVEIEKIAEGEQMSEVQLEKAAEAFNRLQVAAALDNQARYALFEKKAQEAGYSDEQIEDALSKIAAEKVVKNLPMMLATMGMVNSHADKNMQDFKKPKGKGYTQMLGDLDLTKSMGYKHG